MVVTELTDAELLDRARDGDEAAFTALYRRHHPALHRLAVSYRSDDPDDLVDAAFGRVVAELRRRAGPTEAFRAYLFATVHGWVAEHGPETRPGGPPPGPLAATPGPLNATPGPAGATPEPIAATPGAAGATPGPTGTTPEPLAAAPGPPGATPGPVGTTPGTVGATPEPVAAAAALPALGGADRVTITRAFESLPDRWQVPLWHTTVLGADGAALATALGVSATVAAPIGRFADGKLRESYLRAHLDAALRPTCEPHRPRLALHLRGALEPGAADGVRDHLARCDACRELVVALGRVDDLLVRSVVPYFPAGAARPAVPRPLGVTGPSAVVDVTGDVTPVGPAAVDAVGPGRRAGRARLGGRGGSAGSGPGGPAGVGTAGRAGSDPADPGGPAGVGTAGAGRPAGPGAGAARAGGGRAPRLRSAAAVTVLIGGLAVVGTAMARDGGSPTAAPPGDESDASAGGTDPADDVDADATGGRPRDASARSTTTVTDRDDPPDEPADDRVPSQSLPAARSDAGGDRERRSAPAPDAPDDSSSLPSSPTTTAPPTTTPPPDPDPAPAAWQVGWAAASSTGGTLTVTVTSSSGDAEAAPVQVTIQLTGGAHAGALGGGCQASGQTVTCTIAAPPAGSSSTVTVGMTVGGPGESATVSARQADVSLGGARTVALTVPEATPERGTDA